MSQPNANAIERSEDLGTDAQAIARRWQLELKLADKRETKWREKVADIYKTYAPETPKRNTFNILWANTETLRQSVYNSLPQPDARRRYNDEDPLGKAVGETLTRALEFSQDTYDFDGLLKADVLCMLLAGRTLSRVRYIPQVREQEGEAGEVYEELGWEQVICERVRWQDFRILCAASCWDEVTAIGFRHRLTREECIEKFGEEMGKALPMDSADDEDVKKAGAVADLFKTAECWEIWDKEEKSLVWISATYPKALKQQGDPMGLQGFYPIPRPLYAIENDGSLVPACLYTQYEEQANELNRVSARINKLVDVLKVRGVYDATLTELEGLTQAPENTLIPAKNVMALIQNGGLEKAIWMMPIETAAAVLKELYIQRNETKQVIYEITGISDIMRSASDPQETYGAQRIKTQWGTQRLQKLQREVQRYIRDLIRLKAELIAEKFQPETLEKMTLLKYPHQAQVDQANAMAMLQYKQQSQQAIMQAQQTGQPPQLPPPPQPQNPITWEQIVEAMRSDATRTYRIDIETDSTLTASQEGDVEGIESLLKGISGFVQGVGPAVQSGALPVEAVKEIVMAITRRARMGSAVEDALSKIQEPKPPVDPNAAKAQADLQLQQAKAQSEQQMQQMQQQHDAQLEQMKAQISTQAEAAKMQMEAELEQRRIAFDAQLESHKQAMQAQQVAHQNELEAARQMQEAALEKQANDQKLFHEQILLDKKLDADAERVKFEAATKIVIAEISAKQAADTARISAEQAADKEVNKDLGGADVGKFAEMHAQSMEKISQVMEKISKPKKVIRDKGGKVTGVE